MDGEIFTMFQQISLLSLGNADGKKAEVVPLNKELELKLEKIWDDDQKYRPHGWKVQIEISGQ